MVPGASISTILADGIETTYRAVARVELSVEDERWIVPWLKISRLGQSVWMLS